MMTWDLFFDTMCRIVARRDVTSFVPLSASVLEIFQKTGWGPFRPPPNGVRVNDGQMNAYNVYHLM